MKGNQVEQCPKHETDMLYYCNTCKTSTCSDCAMFGTEHKDHNFSKLTEIYDKHVEMIKKEAGGLRKRLKDLNFYMNEV